ncbi:MAG TPA: hypothetical protein PLV37_03350, partial [Bacillota bacterium]|nr:hypothetical protein [Bacillota bacterium]
RGLALATSIAAIVNAFMLYYLLHKKYPKIRIITDWAKVLKIILSATSSILLSWSVFTRLRDTADVHSFVALAVAVAAAVTVYLIWLKIFRVGELSMLREMLRF